jgi:hypothetical protein
MTGCAAILPLFGELAFALIRANSAHLRQSAIFFAPSKCLRPEKCGEDRKNLLGMLLDIVWLRAR